MLGRGRDRLRHLRGAAIALVVIALPLAVAPASAHADPDPSGCSSLIVVTGGGFGVSTDVQAVTCGSGSGGGGGGGGGNPCMFEVVTIMPPGFEIGWRLPGAPMPDLNLYVWYLETCPSGGQSLVAVPIGMAIINGVLVSPWSLALEARNLMTLPLPAMRFNPDVSSSAGAATMVNLPTWWWATNWIPRDQVTAAGPVWARVTATPLSLAWSPGDGNSPVICDGPGLAWRDGLSDNDPQACTYTYTRSSAAASHHHFTATATMTWGITWVGSGGFSGTLPVLLTAQSLPIAAIERQALVVSGHG